MPQVEVLVEGWIDLALEANDCFSGLVGMASDLSAIIDLLADVKRSLDLAPSDRLAISCV